MPSRFRLLTGHLNDVERRIEKAAWGQAQLLEPGLIQTAFATSAGLELLISSYANGDSDYRTGIGHLLSVQLKYHIENANCALATLNQISEPSINANSAALEAH